MRLKQIKNNWIVAKNKIYSIAYQEISTGENVFEFDLPSKFFTSKDNSEILDGECNVVLRAEKTNNSLTLDIDINGKVKVVCDRCLDEFYIPVTYEGTLIVKFSADKTSGEIDDDGVIVDTDGEITADVFWQNPADEDIDLEQYLYESICLSLPYQKVHPTDERGILMCNEEMLSRFNISDSDEEY